MDQVQEQIQAVEVPPAVDQQIIQPEVSETPGTPDTSSGDKKVFGGFNSLLKSIQDLPKETPEKEVKASSVEEGDKKEVAPEAKPENEPEKKEDKTPEEEVDVDNFKFKSFDKMSKEEAVKVAKSFQSKKDKIENEFKKTQTAYGELQTKAQDLQNQINYILADPVGFVKEIAPEGLGNMNAEIERWQNTDLKAELQKEFPHEVDEGWVPDPNEIWKPGTASYEFTARTNDKRQELRNRIEYSKQFQEAKAQHAKQQQEYMDSQNQKDLQRLKDEGITTEMLKEWSNQTMQSINPNDPFPETDSRRAYNMVYGVFHKQILELKKAEWEKGVELKIKEAVDKVHADYRKLGVKVNRPPDKVPDISSVPKITETPKVESKSEAYSPLNRLINKL